MITPLPAPCKACVVLEENGDLLTVATFFTCTTAFTVLLAASVKSALTSAGREFIFTGV